VQNSNTSKRTERSLDFQMTRASCFWRTW